MNINKVIISYTCGLILILFASLQELNAQHHHEYGTVDFELSCNEPAAGSFHNGLALMHHMMYEQSREEFKSAAEADANCAMAHWGIAMSYIHPLWGQRPSDENLKNGSQAVAEAKRINPSTEREKAYIEAVEAFYKDWQTTSYRDQLVAFEEGYRQLHELYSEDVDAAAYYALGHLATAPPDDETLSHQRKAGAMLEELHEQNPNHPGLFHYIIHAYDNPKLADLAENVAREYDKIAPDVPHALHMPSHIFVRLGVWPDVIDWNERSAEAALRQSTDQHVSLHYVHALDYLTYAHLQRGEDQKAKSVVEKTVTIENLQEHLGSAYAVAAARARYALEREKWEEAANIPVQPSNVFSLEKFPAAESIIQYARGIGSARSNDTDGAAKAIEELNRIYDQLTDLGESYWAVLTDAQRTSIQAWKTFAEGNKDRAVSLMRKAAETEDSVDKHPVTPGHVLPARELLGDMFLKMDRPDEALKAFQASLAISANRFRSLFGAGQAAELAGKKNQAKVYYSKLIEISSEDEVERPAFDKVKRFLAAN